MCLLQVAYQKHPVDMPYRLFKCKSDHSLFSVYSFDKKLIIFLVVSFSKSNREFADSLSLLVTGNALINNPF